MTLRRAIFLDRDGTINVNRADHVKSLDEFILLPGAIAAVRQLAALPLAIIVVSNQSVINRGLATLQTVEAINEHLRQTVEAQGGRLDGVYICPHSPAEQCLCRKPRPGLLYQARDEHGLDLAGSYLVGDAATDVELARSVGCQPILVLTGRGEAQRAGMTPEQQRGVVIVNSLAEATNWILAEEERRAKGATTP